MTPEERIHDGNRAKEILDNPVFQQVFTDYRTEITDQWMKSPARDLEGREKLWLMLSMLTKLEAMLKTTLDSGKLSMKDLEYKQSMADRAKSLIGIR